MPTRLPDLSARRRREHCKNPNTAGQGIWVSAREWGLVTLAPGVEKATGRASRG